MGKILNGILGGVSGKVSGVIGSSWKGINYIRGYAIPANPQTPAQTAQRAKMAFLVKIGKGLLEPVLNPLWSAQANQMSAFNVFLQKNLKRITDDTDYENILVGAGNLASVEAGEVLYTVSDGHLGFSYLGPTPDPFETHVDHLVFIGIHKPSGLVYTSSVLYEHDGANSTVLMPSGLTPSDIQGYCFAYKGTGSEIEMCNSTNLEADPN
jgi:hypothetical protein